MGPTYAEITRIGWEVFQRIILGVMHNLRASCKSILTDFLREVETTFGPGPSMTGLGMLGLQLQTYLQNLEHAERQFTQTIHAKQRNVNRGFTPLIAHNRSAPCSFMRMKGG